MKEVAIGSWVQGGQASREGYDAMVNGTSWQVQATGAVLMVAGGAIIAGEAADLVTGPGKGKLAKEGWKHGVEAVVKKVGKEGAEGLGENTAKQAIKKAEKVVTEVAEQSNAAKERTKNIAKGIPESQLGPSGKPKVHVVEKSTKKETIDAAREAGGSKPIKHTQDAGQPTHYHPTDRSGDKLAGKKNVHFQQRGAKPNPKKND